MKRFDVSLSIVRLKNRIARCIPYSIHFGPRGALDRRTALIVHDSMREFRFHMRMMNDTTDMATQLSEASDG